MAVWKYACKTIQGINLDLKLVGRKDLPLKLTRAVSGSGNISPTQLMGLTEIIDPVQELQLLDVIEHIDEKRVMIPVILRNPTVKKSYSMYQIGIYAEDPDLGEILYIVLQSEGAEEIPSGAEMKDFKLEWYINLSVSNSENIEVVIDETGVLTVEQADARYVLQIDYNQTIEEIRITAKTDKEDLEKDIKEAGKKASEYTDKMYQQVTEETDEKIKELHVENKVDKVAGKGLSTNDYTTEEKEKLSGIASGAEVNVQADWNVTNTKSDAYIKNKPTSLPASDVSDWAKQPQKPQYTKSEIGLGNVNNTSDASKPVSSAQQAAIDAAYQQSTAYADLIVNALINGAPGDLDTIGELAQAMENNKDVVAVLRAAIGSKADQAELDGHTENSTIHVTATERKKWNNGSANYGTCSTAAATAAKTVACTGFELENGAEITVKFTVTNTAANPTLNVNSTGAKPIYYRGAAITAGYLAANRTYIFRYNGAQYDLVGDIDSNNKYSNMTAATDSAAGKAGLVPAPPAGAQNQFLAGNATWQYPFAPQIVTTANTNLNDYITPGIYYFSSTYKPINIPTGVNGWLIVLTDESTMVKQIWMRHGTAGSNDHMTYVRMLSGSTWGDWKRYAMSDEVDAKISKSGDTMEGILNLKDELRINDGVTNRRVMLLRNPQTYGVEVLLGGGGNTFVGSGESYYTLQEDLSNEEVVFASEIEYSPTAERFYLTSDQLLYLLANCNGHGTAIGYCITAGGHLVPTGQNQNIGNGNHTLDTVYANNLTGNSGSATKWETPRNINGMSIDGTESRANYGSCSTAAATAAKTVACDGFALVTGAEITVKFTVTNTAANPTLNVNSTGAKPIYYRGAAITAGYLAANRTYIFRYNGAQYDLVGDIDTNTKYTAASAVPQMDGTAATGSSTKYAREDHVHPSDTTKAAADHNHDSAYAPKSHSHDYLPLAGGILKGHVNVNADNSWIFGGYDTNLLNIYTRNIEASTGDYLYIKAPKYIDLLCNSYVEVKSLDDSKYIPIYAKAFNTTSSRKVKENIQDMTAEEASKILDIDVVTFDYIARAGGDKNQRGCIAEDVYKIIPSVVSIPDEYDDTEEFEDGKIPHVPGIDYSKFVPYLIKMVQMQNERIDNLEKEIEMLKK